MKLPNKEEIFKISYNMLTFLMILEGIIMMIEVWRGNYTPKAFFYLGFLILTRLSQINTILYFKRD